MTLRQFARRWPRGSYAISGRTDEGEALGVCATEAELWDLVDDGVLQVHPMNVPVRDWEVTVELEDGSHPELSLRLPARGPHAQTSVTIPAEFLQSVAPDTPAKLEVGAIGGRLEAGDDDNWTFTELLKLCLNRRNGCPAGGD